MDTTVKRKPIWLKKRIPSGKTGVETRGLLKSLNLNTVCQSALCPNKGECFDRGVATFMILGETCTRNCGFCNVKHGAPKELDLNEPDRVAQAVLQLGLKHVVITSVSRDDLEDYGATGFVNTVKAIRNICKEITIEVLTPDFLGKKDLIELVSQCGIDVFNHNIETVPSLYSKVRSEANFERSLQVIRYAKEINSSLFTKSGLMVGLGESEEEVLEVMDMLIQAKCDFLTIGQYLQPSKNNFKVKEFIKPEQFLFYKEAAQKKGFLSVGSESFVRSSYNADEMLNSVKKP